MIARNQLVLAGKERDLAELRLEHAGAVAEFLATRFTNVELFEWMSAVLGRVYAFFLQQATALAQLAEAQLAFERQEPAAGLIAGNYWRTDAEGTDGSVDRRGLTGSARLQQALQRLDQHAFDTDRRKLHLTQTLSVAELAGYELQQFRGTGVLTFATPEALFDRDFPGHYLRLIRQVRVSLIALLPPVRGIRATLSTSGVSRIVVARGPFATVTLRREPESIAVTAPMNANGMFELQPETSMLAPFEGMGVDAIWRFELPKAANTFDYRTIADVLLTIDYTAVHSAEYREQVLRNVDRSFITDRSFSIRNEYPDAWYDLHNPDGLEDANRVMHVVLPLRSEDFPAHIEDLVVVHLSLFCVRAPELTEELTVVSLQRTDIEGSDTAGEARTTSGAISTRRPGGDTWQPLLGGSPIAEWDVQLRDDSTVRAWFRDGLIQDLVLIMTLSGATPDWPR